MSRTTLSLRLMVALCTTLLVVLLIDRPDTRASSSPDLNAKERTDGIVIDLAAIPDSDQMPGVLFFHDLHTEKVKDNDCSVCHLKENDRFVFKFKRLKDTDTKTDMVVYHDNCVACHVENKAAGKKSGPLKAECRDCHNAKAGEKSSWKPMKFDRSLHSRHEMSKSIAGNDKLAKDLSIKDNAQKEGNCSACHHSFDETKKKTYYAKGKEESCSYCHIDGVKGENDARNLKEASHSACVNCHLVEMKNFAGPVNCKGCHDLQEQGKIQKLQQIPRLKRGQPDLAVMTAVDSGMTSPEKIVEASGKMMNPVIFDHKNHENSSESCKSCHHKSLESCKTCHTAAGDKKGGYVNLEKAMHDIKNKQSCIGCHNEVKKTADCAGCHAQMPVRTFAGNDRNCLTCHSTDMKISEELLTSKEKMASDAQQIVEKRESSYSRFADKDIPEKVTIGYISDKYEASEFPHAKVIKAIEKRIEGNRLAKVFHGDEKTLCLGCHHNAPVTEKPQKCSSCHGKTEVTGDGRPGLKGAYHGQCITCHQKMKIETVSATDCNKCHKEK